jgi:hypothetical protein
MVGTLLVKPAIASICTDTKIINMGSMTPECIMSLGESMLGREVSIIYGNGNFEATILRPNFVNNRINFLNSNEESEDDYVLDSIVLIAASPLSIRKDIHKQFEYDQGEEIYLIVNQTFGWKIESKGQIASPAIPCYLFI